MPVLRRDSRTEKFLGAAQHNGVQFMAELSAQALQDLRQQLNAAVVASASAPAAAAAAPADFCSAYKVARPILQLLVTVLPVLFPGPGTGMAAAISALIALGDKICPPT